jgi:hypothetical protein
MYLIGRTRLGLSQAELELMTYSKWAEIYHLYRRLANFEAKRGLYQDIEAENEAYAREHRPVASVMDL